METDSVRRLINQARDDPQFFHDLVFICVNAIESQGTKLVAWPLSYSRSPMA